MFNLFKKKQAPHSPDGFINWCMRPVHKSASDNFFKLEYQDGFSLVKRSSIRGVEFKRKPKVKLGD